MFESTRPTQVKEIRTTIVESKMIRATLDLTYLGRFMVARKKIVDTTMTWVEGKDDSPEPLGRVATGNIRKIA